MKRNINCSAFTASSDYYGDYRPNTSSHDVPNKVIEQINKKCYDKCLEFRYEERISTQDNSVLKESAFKPLSIY